MRKVIETIGDEEVVFDDYPINKFAKKIDWWTSEKGIGLIRSWRQHGLSIKDIYQKMGVDPRTFRTWRRKCPELEEALAFGREVTNAKVVDALYKRAVGFYYTEQTSQLIEGEMMLVKEVRKYCPPDTKAILAWLYNRYGAEWRSIQEPVDTDTPTLQNADQVLVRIKELSEGLRDDLASAGGVDTSETTETEEEATTGQGENNDD